MKATTLACLLASTLAVSTAAWAETPSHAHSAAHPAATVPMLEGLGPLHHPVSTRNPDAQRYFDQGLRLAWAFNHDEAFRAFEQASRLDTNLAMAHWGMALVSGPNINLPMDEDHAKLAWSHLQEAMRRSRSAPQNERDYIAALAKRYAADPKAERGPLDTAYKEAMGELVKKYPDDLDAATLFAESAMDLRPWQYWLPDGTPNAGTEEIVATLESVLRRDPHHIGANHLYIHALEASPHPERALGAAHALEGLAPGAGHLVHMPTHIYGRLGQHETSAKINEHAAEVDRAYIDKYKIEGVYPMMYFTHNLQFSAYSYAQAGNYKDAIRMGDQVTDRALEMAKVMPMAEFATPTSTLIRIRFRRWAELMKSLEPPASSPYAHLMWRVGRGMAEAATGNVARAEAELQAVSKERQATPADLLLGFSPARSVMGVAEHLLAGRIAERRGRTAEAAERLERAVAMEDSLPYDEPPDWYLHTREALGGLYLRTGKWSDAEQAFRADLALHPRNGRSLFGLAQALEGRGQKTEAELVREQFQSVWKIADVRLAVADL
jgi:tetratricopeptide (TPR) repeat protein